MNRGFIEDNVVIWSQIVVWYTNIELVCDIYLLGMNKDTPVVGWSASEVCPYVCVYMCAYVYRSADTVFVLPCVSDCMDVVCISICVRL